MAITRRSFLAALSCLPFVGKYFAKEPKRYDWLEGVTTQSTSTFYGSHYPPCASPNPIICQCAWHQGLRDMANEWDQRALREVYGATNQHQSGNSL